MGFLLELVLEAVWMLVGDLVFGLLGAIFERSRDRLAPSWRFGRDRARLMVALAPLVGAAVGSLSLTLAPRRLTSAAAPEGPRVWPRRAPAGP